LTWRGVVSTQALEELRDELRSLTTEQLADVLGVEVWRVREMVKAGEAPPHLKLGRTYRFPVPGVRKWFAERTKEG
jgi:excisionase family DNA binding protein